MEARMARGPGYLWSEDSKGQAPARVDAEEYWKYRATYGKAPEWDDRASLISDHIEHSPSGDFLRTRALAPATVNQTGKTILLMRSYGKSTDEIAKRLKDNFRPGRGGIVNLADIDWPIFDIHNRLSASRQLATTEVQDGYGVSRAVAG
jgi:hypothetical protein